MSHVTLGCIRLVTLRVLVACLATGALTGCFPEELTTPPVYEAPQVFSPTGVSGGTHPGGGVASIRVEVNANAFLDRLEIREGSTLLEERIFEVQDGANQVLSYVYTVSASAAVGSNISLNFVLTDRQGQTSAPYTYTVTVGPPIVPAFFTRRDTSLGGQVFKYLSGSSNQLEVLDADTLYLVNDTLRLADGGILQIEAGTALYFTRRPGGTTTGSLRIGITSRIEAQGTQDNPIVFSSLDQAPGQAPDTVAGDWGGVRIEGLGTGDDSGVLRYLRFEFGGAIDASSDPLDPSATNTLRLTNVGSGTEVDFLQFYRCNGDAMLVEGADANVRHIFGLNNGESTLRWANGWVGFAQFVVCNSNFGKDGERDMRSDEGSSLPSISNVTLLGPGSIAGSPNSNRGIRLTNGARGRFYNMLVTEFRFSQGIRTDGGTITDENGTLVFLYTHSWNNSNSWHSSTGTLRTFEGNTEDDPTVGTDAGIAVGDFVGVYRPNAQFDPTTLDPWFQSANYSGAVPTDNDWTSAGTWARNLDGTIR